MLDEEAGWAGRSDPDSGAAGGGGGRQGGLHQGGRHGEQPDQ